MAQIAAETRFSKAPVQLDVRAGAAQDGDRKIQKFVLGEGTAAIVRR